MPCCSTHTHTHTHARTHARTHTHIHTHAHPRTLTHTYTTAQSTLVLHMQQNVRPQRNLLLRYITLQRNPLQYCTSTAILHVHCIISYAKIHHSKAQSGVILHNTTIHLTTTQSTVILHLQHYIITSNHITTHCILDLQ